MNYTELTNIEIKKLFAKFLLPSIFAMLGISVNIICDTIFIGQGVGKDGLSALGIAIPVYSLYNAVSLIIAMGGATLFSIFLGKNDQKSARSVYSSSILMALTIGLIVSFFGFIYSENIAKAFGASRELLNLTDTYLKIILFSGFNFILSGVLAVFLRNDGAPKVSMMAVITGSLTNIVLDYIFIIRLGMGMRGAAIATGIAPAVTITIILIWIFKNPKNMRFSVADMKNKIGFMPKILAIGWSSSLIEISSAIVIIIFNYTILSIIGPIGIAAYSIIANIAMVGTSILTGAGQSVQPIISVNYGAGIFSRVEAIKHLAERFSLFTGIFIFSVIMLFTKPIIMVFNSTDSQLLELTSNGIRLYFLAFILMGINIVNISFFQAISYAKISNTLSFIRGFILMITNLYILSGIFGINGVWLTLPATELGSFIAVMAVIRILKRKNIYLQSDPH